MTGHIIKVGSTILESDGVIRSSFAYILNKEQIGGLPIYKTLLACDDSIIPPKDGTIYIVSHKTCEALKDRLDLYVVHNVGRDKRTGKPFYCKGLKRNPYYSGN